jgi:DNA-binding PadR family transcriptional regulator
MAISQAQWRTLNLLDKKPAYRVYRSDRADDYSWVHDDTHISLTPTLHRLFSRGYAMTSPENRNVAILTEKGREMVAVRGGG